ncbi:MAG: G8 domain-containing protein [Verrucomicrobiales bacterium]|nr:G8 domain-containing protein [Verrucomicrobiales bacterium]MCP5559179.1 G8 domain-containing protein [Verrucomicrobiaceae bacterium]
MRFLALFVSLTLPSLGAGPVIRSTQSGAWSAAETWEGGKVPSSGATVLVRTGHRVTYDVVSAEAVRSLHIAGTLTFAQDRDTRLDVGLVRVQRDESVDEDGFACDAHIPEGGTPGALLVGTEDAPIDAKHTALIRLVAFDGQDPESCPAIVDCGARMEFHGAEMNRTWVKLGSTAKAGDAAVTLAEPVTGWKAGDRVVIVSTNRQSKHPDKKTFREHAHDLTETEERLIRTVNGAELTLDAPLAFNHTVEGRYRGEIANLSRNVIVESADPAKARGHTMFHRGSSGAIHYAEFRHLGKEGVLGRYSIHFHLVRDTMRGASVIGASIWDSGNRWITIHGTDYLVVRDCVGYRSTGHGFFLEDGTEVFNVLDRNLAIQAEGGKPLPNQVLPFDHNDGAGFWWANSLNTFTRNVAADCDEYGYRFDAVESPDFSLTLNVPRADGTRALTDVRTLPFVRFEGNESHTQRRHAFNFGGFSAEARNRENQGRSEGVAGIGPDEQHPFVIKDYLAWDVHWALHPRPPCLMLDGMEAAHSHYALWFANYDRHAYRDIKLNDITVNPDFQPIGTQPKPSEYPGKLHPIDDLPPTTVITDVRHQADGSLLIHGTTADNGIVKQVLVNGEPAHELAPNFAQWQITLPQTAKLKASAIGGAGNEEAKPHELAIHVAE